jgi:chromosome partitioning protein
VAAIKPGVSTNKKQGRLSVSLAAKGFVELRGRQFALTAALPSNITLTRTEESLINRTGREQRLRVALDKVADDYDWVLVDCPPTLGVLTVGALSAADQVLIPLQAETLSHRGVGQLLDTVHDVKQFINSELQIMGVLPTMYDGRTNHAKAVLAAIEETYELPIIQPPIPKTIRFAEAPAIGRSILGTSKHHKGAEAYRQVAAAMLNGHAR